MGMQGSLTEGQGFGQKAAALHPLSRLAVDVVKCSLRFAVLVEEGWLLPVLLLQPLSKGTALPTALLTAPQLRCK